MFFETEGEVNEYSETGLCGRCADPAATQQHSAP